MTGTGPSGRRRRTIRAGIRHADLTTPIGAGSCKNPVFIGEIASRAGKMVGSVKRGRRVQRTRERPLTRQRGPIASSGLPQLYRAPPDRRKGAPRCRSIPTNSPNSRTRYSTHSCSPASGQRPHGSQPPRATSCTTPSRVPRRPRGSFVSIARKEGRDVEDTFGRANRSARSRDACCPRRTPTSDSRPLRPSEPRGAHCGSPRTS